MSDQQKQHHGLAASIRASRENTTFDLAGIDPTTASSICADAFSTDFDPRNVGAFDDDDDDSDEDDSSNVTMIHITFVVGGGKKESRNRYDDKLTRSLTSALQNQCGYVEDRGAGCVAECGVSFKSQHDTGNAGSTRSCAAG